MYILLRPIFLSLFFIISLQTNSQSYITGKVVDTSHTPLPFIPIALLRATDSSIIKGSITDEVGGFLFNGIQSGSYLLKVAAVGFYENISGSYKLDSSVNLSVPAIVLSASSTQLTQVEIVTTRNRIEFKNGNTFVTIENSPLAIGNSVLELLSRLPGVVVDNNQISIQGKSGVKVLIDGSIQQLSNEQLMSLLRSMNSATIEKIEILKNPPIKYDASGTGGLINIKTKKVKLLGFSGDATVAASQGRFRRSDIGVSLYYKHKKAVFFSNLNLDYSTFQALNSLTKTIRFDSTTTLLYQGDTIHYFNKSISYKVGVDWYLNNANTLGVKVEGNPGVAILSHQGNNQLSNSSLGYNQLVYNSKRPNDWNYINYNLNASHAFDTLGAKLNFSTDYGQYPDVYLGSSDNEFYNNTTSPLLPKIMRNKNVLDLVLISSKLDFEKKICNEIALEAGIKTAYQKMKSDYLFENKDPLTGIYVKDLSYTNTLFYTEQVNAAYINLRKAYKKWNTQMGLRGEQTAITIKNLTALSRTKNYFNLFPVVSIDYAIAEASSIQFAYNKRLNRPGYNSYNPFKFFDNLFTSSQGNPDLQPEYNNTFELTHTINGLSNTVSYSIIRNQITDYTSQNDATKETVFLITNLDRCKTATYSLFYQQEISTWWSVTINASASHISYSGYIKADYYKASAFSYTAFFTSQFMLPKQITIELNAQYFGPGLTGIYAMKSRGNVNIGAKKTLLKKHLMMGIGLEDVFFTSVARQTVNFQNQHWHLTHKEDSRRFKISITYNFGKLKVEERNTISNDEEQNRLAH